MIVAGLDAASTTGWAVVEAGAGRPRVLGYGAVNATRFAEVVGVVEAIVARRAVLACIEVPFVKANPQTAIVLGRIVGRWEEELDRAGIVIELVRPEQWQGGVLTGLICRTSRREERKRAARVWVERVHGLQPKTEDECDAIGLATWGAQRANIKSRAVGGAAAPSARRFGRSAR